jgi:hypothetical protein
MEPLYVAMREHEDDTEPTAAVINAERCTARLNGLMSGPEEAGADIDTVVRRTALVAPAKKNRPKAAL